MYHLDTPLLSLPAAEASMALLLRRWIHTERYAQNRTQIDPLSFPLLLCLKLVADASPHHGAGTTFHTRPPSCLWVDPKHLIASNTSIDLIEPLGSTYESFWNEPDVVTAAAAVAPWWKWNELITQIDQCPTVSKSCYVFYGFQFLFFYVGLRRRVALCTE